MTLQELEKINLDVKNLADKACKNYYFGRFIPNNRAIFVGEMPTINSNWDPRDNFNLPQDQKFLELLNKYGFGGCYITDIVKTVSEPRRPTPEEIETFLPILKLEIQIINPKIIIALGEQTQQTLADNGIKAEKIWLPVYPRRYNRWIEYENQVKQLAVLTG